MISLEGKTALVTGSARGIGAATAIMMAEYGADIIVVDLKETEDAHATMKAIRDLEEKLFHSL